LQRTGESVRAKYEGDIHDKQTNSGCNAGRSISVTLALGLVFLALGTHAEEPQVSIHSLRANRQWMVYLHVSDNGSDRSIQLHLHLHLQCEFTGASDIPPTGIAVTCRA
jgi:hypothetical protein